MLQLSHPYMTIGKTIALTIQTFISKVMSLLFNMLPRFVIAFLPRSKHLFISWLQSPSTVILEPKKIKPVSGGGGGLVANSCPSNSRGPMGCSLPGSSVHASLLAKILEWVAISFSRGSSWPRNWTWASCTAGRLLTDWAIRKDPCEGSHCFHFFPFYLPWSDGTGCHDLCFLNAEFQASFLTVLFHFHQEAFLFLFTFCH